MGLKDEIHLWPRLNIEYLEPEQIDHEIFIRNMPVVRNTYGSYAPSTLKAIQKEISSDPYDPLSVGHLRIDSPEGRARQQVEFTRCKNGICSLDNNALNLDAQTITHRAMHFLFRLERLQLLPLEDVERKVGLRKKARNLINQIQFRSNDPPPQKPSNRHESLIDIEGDENDVKGNTASAQAPSNPTILDNEPEFVNGPQHTEQNVFGNDMPNRNTGTIPKSTPYTIPSQTNDIHGIEQRFNDRLSAIEARQSERQPSVTHIQFDERMNCQRNVPYTYSPRPPTDAPIFQPHSNSTYRSEHDRSGRERDINTFKKIDALSKWRLCFNGTTVDEKHLALNDYIISIERFIKLQKLNPDDVLPYLLPTLSGNARIWYNAEGDSITTLANFFRGLRDNFDYKQNATDVMAAVLKHQFDPGQERLITHINRMECEMANCNIPPSTQLDLVLKTLPENLRMMAATRDVKNLIDLRKWALKLFPPTIGEVKAKRKDFRRFDEKKKSVSAVHVSDGESNDDNQSDSDDEEVLQQACELVRQLKFRPNFKPRIKPIFRKPKNGDVDSSNPSSNNDSNVDLSKIEGNEEAICFQCKLFGHSFQNCPSPRRFAFCYGCGRPGIQNRSKCPSPSCMTKCDSKNA